MRYLILAVLFMGCSTEPEVVHGCLDSTACNYNPLTTLDNKSCIYEADECGVCGGDNSDKDCEGVCFGSAENCFIGTWEADLMVKDVEGNELGTHSTELIISINYSIHQSFAPIGAGTPNIFTGTWYVSNSGEFCKTFEDISNLDGYSVTENWFNDFETCYNYTYSPVDVQIQSGHVTGQLTFYIGDVEVISVYRLEAQP